MEHKFKAGDKIVGKTAIGIDLATVYKETPYFVPDIVSSTPDYIALKDQTFTYLCKPGDIRLFSEFEDAYQNPTDIQVGDTVRCISENKSKFSYVGAFGWEKDLEFKVTEVNDYGSYKVYFGGRGGNGVYSDAVRLVKRADPKSLDAECPELEDIIEHESKTEVYPEYVQAPEDGADIAKDALYKVENPTTSGFYIIDDRGTIRFCLWKGCACISLKDWIQIPNNVYSEPSVEERAIYAPGNWVKFTWNKDYSFAKVREFKDGKVYFDEVISTEKGKHTYKKRSAHWIVANASKTELVRVEAIQEYLPDDHQDKIPIPPPEAPFNTWKRGAYVRFKGTKGGMVNEDWEQYFGKYGLMKGDVAKICNYYTAGIYVEDIYRDTSNGVLYKIDLELISKEEYLEGLEKMRQRKAKTAWMERQTFAAPLPSDIGLHFQYPITPTSDGMIIQDPGILTLLEKSCRPFEWEVAVGTRKRSKKFEFNKIEISQVNLKRNEKSKFIR